jgi:hypothetical protein
MPGVDMTAQGLRDLLGPDPTCSGQSASWRAAAYAWMPSGGSRRRCLGAALARSARRVPGPAHGAAAGAKCVIASVPCRF